MTSNMHIDEQTHMPTLSSKPPRGFSKYLAGGIIATTIILLGLCVGAWWYAKKYDGVIAPNVFVGSVDIGRKTEEQARLILQKRADEFLTHGIDVRLNNTTRNLKLSTLIGSDLVEYVHFDIEQTLENAAALRHDPNPAFNTVGILYSLLRPAKIPMVFTVYEKELNLSLHALFADSEQLAQETTFLITQNGTDWDVRVKPGSSGDQVDNTVFSDLLTTALRGLTADTIELTKTERAPLVSADTAEQEVPIVKAILSAAPYTFSYTQEKKPEQTWSLTAADLAKLLTPSPNGTVSLEKEAFLTFLEPIQKSINVAAQNARFEIKDNRAVKFAESKNGITLDVEALYTDTLAQITQGATTPIPVKTVVELPTVKTGDVNNIGIDELLGQGYSSYKNSPKNRRLNIQNGVDLLNGLLIAPGETFSLLEALKPFTIENGYLRELVIRGDKIEPDIGGGLCQIGTTAFRAVMHAGLPIIARQNHSLVVSYYNDPSNNLPGTDATIFDPAPDFKFKNDTGQYVLFQAENNTETSELTFSIWGTSDGRVGSYTPPKVSRWIPYGETIIQTSTTLKPGEEKCQEAHKGADASFTYTVTQADGTKTERVFTSHYRPLPKICLVGVDPAAPTTPPDTTE